MSQPQFPPSFSEKKKKKMKKMKKRKKKWKKKGKKKGKKKKKWGEKMVSPKKRDTFPIFVFTEIRFAGFQKRERKERRREREIEKREELDLGKERVKGFNSLHSLSLSLGERIFGWEREKGKMDDDVADSVTKKYKIENLIGKGVCFFFVFLIYFFLFL